MADMNKLRFGVVIATAGLMLGACGSHSETSNEALLRLDSRGASEESQISKNPARPTQPVITLTPSPQRQGLRQLPNEGSATPSARIESVPEGSDDSATSKIGLGPDLRSPGGSNLSPSPSPKRTEPVAEDCTPGYSPCLPPASDYDCAGGSGNGPAYTGRVEVTGPDIYGLDRDNDGIGCE